MNVLPKQINAEAVRLYPQPHIAFVSLPLLAKTHTWCWGL